ncbi:ubiquitin-like modifier-activating enzyme 5 [Cryptosporidium felis]|nr:ubiquitin-like modifier-activating enzyme 5 [Cryptosporidium felis]
MEKSSDEKEHICERYSRVLALESLGVVKDYFLIRNKVIVVVGVGGIGSVVVEMLARCGIENLVIVDFDIVELSNMNRMFYNLNHIGMNKVDACIENLKLINPHIKIEKYNINIVEEYPKFCEIFKNNDVDILVSCVDNYSARSTISQTCNELDIVWFESGISENAISGHIQIIIPGVTACYSCAPPLVNFDDLQTEDTIISSIFESVNSVENRKEVRTCAASLATTTSIISGLLVNNILKYFLKVGEKSHFLGYHMLDDYFPRYSIMPNKDCNDKWCLQRQKEKESNTINQKPSELLNEHYHSTRTRSTKYERHLDFEITESNTSNSNNKLEDLNGLTINELTDKLEEITQY